MEAKENKIIMEPPKFACRSSKIDREASSTQLLSQWSTHSYIHLEYFGIVSADNTLFEKTGPLIQSHHYYWATLTPVIYRPLAFFSGQYAISIP